MKRFKGGEKRKRGEEEKRRRGEEEKRKRVVEG